MSKCPGVAWSSCLSGQHWITFSPQLSILLEKPILHWWKCPSKNSRNIHFQYLFIYFLKKGGLKLWWSTPFYLSENYFVRAKLYLRPETPEDKMKESSSSEVEVADWIYLTRSSVSTEHSKANFWMLCKPPNQRLQEHHRHSAVLNHCENYWEEERAIKALPTHPRIYKLNPEVRLILWQQLDAKVYSICLVPSSCEKYHGDGKKWPSSIVSH